MDATLLLKDRRLLDEDVFVELVVWQMPKDGKKRSHLYKYRLALVVDGECVLRYDNERGKGDHRHYGDREEPYEFRGIDDLIDDFWADVSGWRRQNG